MKTWGFAVAVLPAFAAMPWRCAFAVRKGHIHPLIPSSTIPPTRRARGGGGRVYKTRGAPRRAAPRSLPPRSRNRPPFGSPQFPSSPKTLAAPPPRALRLRLRRGVRAPSSVGSSPLASRGVVTGGSGSSGDTISKARARTNSSSAPRGAFGSEINHPVRIIDASLPALGASSF
ncbi:hypothetical protein DAI22_03g045200 [Oryza sativa Japonica Group]|nr:hypothetical protein DAI22_03g045200 [Oryza sativa Japonica Group]